MERQAKKVKVIHRWKADETGDIPLEDDNMFGTAMKIAGHMNGIPEVIETVKPAVKNAAWLNAHIAAPYLITNAGFKVGADTFDSWKIEGGKVAYSLGSYLGHLVVNGPFGNYGETFRGITVGTGSMLLGLHHGQLHPLPKLARNAAIGCYAVATVSYAFTKYKNR